LSRREAVNTSEAPRNSSECSLCSTPSSTEIKAIGERFSAIARGFVLSGRVTSAVSRSVLQHEPPDASSPEEGTFISRTTVDQTKYGTRLVSLRAVLASPLTTEHGIEAVLDDQVRLAECPHADTEFPRALPPV
jgi:hypothetical protein